jgi:hypothetical protein
MKVTKNQLRNIVREAVRRKLEMGPDEALVEYDTPLNIDGPSITHEQLQHVINEEFELAIALREELGDYSPGMTMGKRKGAGLSPWDEPKKGPPPLPKKDAGNQLAPGEQLRRFKANVNMMRDAANRINDVGVKEALPWLDKVIDFAQKAKAAVKR